MYYKVARLLVSSEFQVQSQIILDIDYLPDYISVSYDSEHTQNNQNSLIHNADKLRLTAHDSNNVKNLFKKYNLVLWLIR